MKKAICCLLAAAALMGTVGCTGPFKLTKKLHAWHTSQEDRWVDEIVFLACVILPFYAVCTIGDAIIFNSIEFWGGENPIASIDNGDERVKMTQNADGSILIQSAKGSFTLKKSRYGVSAYDSEGNLLYISHTGEDSKVRVYAADGTVVGTYNKS
jgi:hypothetical protein